MIRAAVITFPGSNCDRDLAVAMEAVFGAPVLRVWHQETELPKLDLIGVPGGFSYGDYLRCGAMAARSPVMREVVRRARGRHGRARRVQRLPDPGRGRPAARRPDPQRRAALRLPVRGSSSRPPASSMFTSGYGDAPIRLPVAHHDGNYVIDADGLARLRATRTASPSATATTRTARPPTSPGVLGPKRNVLGLMPHPERAIEPLLGGSDGLPLFRSLLEALA